MFKSRTPPIRDNKGRILKNSIASLEPVRIGGIRQWVLMRGADKNNPLLLFLHGRPGSGQIGFIRKYEQELEKHFIVVNWDQRGAGKSGRKIDPSTMNLAQFVEDTHELITYLLSRFGQEQLFLTGHSRSEEHTSELQSRGHLVCRLLLEKKKKRPEHDGE